jgi:hypothetical protein
MSAPAKAVNAGWEPMPDRVNFRSSDAGDVGHCFSEGGRVGVSCRRALQLPCKNRAANSPAMPPATPGGKLFTTP